MVKFLIPVLVAIHFLASSFPTANAQPVAEPKNELLNDLLGDPLPAGAQLRLGTARLMHPATVAGIALSPDGKTIVSAGYKYLIAWDADTGKEKWRVSDLRLSYDEAYGLRPVVFDPEGRIGYIGTLDNKKIRSFKIETGELTEIELHSEWEDSFGHSEMIRSVDVSSDGKFLVVGSKWGLSICKTDGEHVFQIKNRDTDDVIPGFGDSEDRLAYGGQYSCGKFSPDDKSIAYVNSDEPKLLRTVNAATGESIRSIEFPARIVRFVYSPDGNHLVASLRDLTVRMCDVDTGKETWTTRLSDDGNSESYATAVAFSPDGSKIAAGVFAGKDRHIRLLNSMNGAVTGKLLNKQAKQWSMVFSADSSKLYSSGQDGIVHRWDVSSQKEIDIAGASHATGVCAASFDGRLLAHADDKGNVFVTDGHSGRVIKRLQDAAFISVSQLAFSANNRILAAGGESETQLHVRVWRVPDGELLHQWDVDNEADPTATFTDVSFSQNASRLAFSSYKQSRVYAFDLQEGKPVVTLRHERVNGVSLTADGKQIATAGRDHMLRIWNAESGQPRQKRELKEKFGGMHGVRFSPDGSLLATAHYGEVRIWQVDGLEVINRFNIERWFIGPTIEFSPCGAWLATGSFLGWVQVWDTNCGVCVWQSGEHERYVKDVSFVDGYRKVLSGNVDGMCHLWDPAPEIDEANGEKKISELYVDLIGTDAVNAWHAVWVLSESPDATIKLLEEKLLAPESPLPDERIQKLIEQLNDKSFLNRRAAKQELRQIGGKILERLQKESEETESDERMHGLTTLLGEIRTDERNRSKSRAIELLAQFDSPTANKLLQKIADKKPESQEGQLAAQVLRRRSD